MKIFHHAYCSSPHSSVFVVPLLSSTSSTPSSLSLPFFPSRRSAVGLAPLIDSDSLDSPIRRFVVSSWPFVAPRAVVAGKTVVKDIEIVEVGSGGRGIGGEGFEDGGGGGGNGGDSGGDGGDGANGGESSEGKKTGGLSMSQKFTLAYAALVGVGGVVGYLKSGSQKSLAAGGISALLLFFVHTQLPIRPVLASSLGLGLSAALLSVMGFRFKNSGKVFPAGVVSLVSLVMVGGYAHGIHRGLRHG